jgi:hypothetical protein
MLSDVSLNRKIDPFCFSISKNTSARHGVIKVVELKKNLVFQKSQVKVMLQTFQWNYSYQETDRRKHIWVKDFTSSKANTSQYLTLKLYNQVRSLSLIRGSWFQLQWTYWISGEFQAIILYIIFFFQNFTLWHNLRQGMTE